MSIVSSNSPTPQAAIGGRSPRSPQAPEPTGDNPYLQGNFAPVSREETFFDLEVSGELPADLAGTLLRNGPNPVGVIDDKHHWFVGDAMLHAIRIEGGRARSYRN